MGAHGYFESYADWSNLTAAKFLRTPGKKTPVFVRFSTVLGSRGSPDTVRDVRGFATRFYTEEGLFDLGKIDCNTKRLCVSLHPAELYFFFLIVGNAIAPFFVHGKNPQ